MLDPPGACAIGNWELSDMGAGTPPPAICNRLPGPSMWAFCFVCFETVSLYSPGCLGIHCVDLSGLELKEIQPASVFPSARTKHNMKSICSIFE